MIYAKQDGTLQYIKGDKFILEMLAEIDNTPIDFTNYNAEFIIRDEANIILQLTTQNEDIILGNDGKITITAPANQITNLKAGIYQYDFKIYYPNDNEGETWINNNIFKVLD